MANQDDLALIADRIRQLAPATETHNGKMLASVHRMTCEADQRGAFADVRLAPLRDYFDDRLERRPFGSVSWNMFAALHWLADNAAAIGVAYPSDLPSIAIKHWCLAFPKADCVRPHVHAFATLIESGGRRGALDDAEFVFRPDGNGYFIRGLGEEGHVTAKGAKGLHDIFRVIQSPGVPVPMLELDAGGGTVRLEGDRHSKQLATHEMTLDEIRAKRNEFSQQIAESTDPNEQSELVGQLKDFEETVKGLFGKRGRTGKRTIRDLNNPNDKLRSRIHKRIRDACDSLENSKPKSFPKLAEHFRLTICAAGAGMRYSPGVPDMRWETKPTSHPKSYGVT